jgi:hypothetical protein
MVPACHGLMVTWFTKKARTTSGLAPRVSFCSRRYFFRVRVPVLSLVPSPNSSDGAGMQRHIDCETALAVKDEALQLSGFDYADRLPPEPTLSPWLICLTGSAM